MQTCIQHEKEQVAIEQGRLNSQDSKLLESESQSTNGTSKGNISLLGAPQN